MHCLWVLKPLDWSQVQLNFVGANEMEVMIAFFVGAVIGFIVGVVGVALSL